MSSLLNYFRRSKHIEPANLNAAPIAKSVTVPSPLQISPNVLDPQTLAEFGLPAYLTHEETLEALAPAPASVCDQPRLPDAPAPQALAVEVADEVVLPVTYSTNEEIHNLLQFSEDEAMRLPVIKRHRPYLGLGLHFPATALLEQRGMADWVAVPVMETTFEMIFDRNPAQTRVNNTVMYTATGIPELRVNSTNYNYSWKSYGLVARPSGRLFEPQSYAKPMTLVQAMVNQSLDNSKAVKHVEDPELYLGFADKGTVWDIIFPALNCVDRKDYKVQPSKKQLDYVERQVRRGMPIYANAAGVVIYTRWKKQSSFDIFIEDKQGARIFAGCIPEFGKYYVAEGTEVKPGQLIAAGFPQQVDLDGDGQLDRPATKFEDRQKLSTFLADNGGFKNVIMTVMKNAMRKFGDIVVAPFDVVSRVVEQADPALSLLVWQTNCHTKTELQVEELNGVDTGYAVLLPKARRHGFGTANRSISRDGLVISSAE